MKKITCLIIMAITILVEAFQAKASIIAKEPRIVNMIYFVRYLEPRDPQITTDTLYLATVRSAEQLEKYGLKGTFLLQYDALIAPKYQVLMSQLKKKGNDVGAWWEITEPHVKAAGLDWRGRYPWDWHVNVGFSSGYTITEREKLVDVYMAEFKKNFGEYPTSIGSWFIDAHTIKYIYEKYDIQAVCMCRDQIGTDGYTFWGGYWNQAFYPSKYNCYMPAQTKENQIPVPVFRMLGSDPAYQYDSGIGGNVQGVITLEPVYPEAGGSKEWVEWFFKSMFTDPALGFNYVQAGQENSFTWPAMKNGLNIQVPLIADYAKKGIIKIETLTQSGQWYKKKYPLTASTALSALSDFRVGDRKTVWYNSRFYRANMIWKGDEFAIRDIHLFDERFKSNYCDRPTNSNQCIFMTLPFLDGFLWSTKDEHAQIRIAFESNNGTWSYATCANPVVTTKNEDLVVVECPLEQGRIAVFSFEEKRISVRVSGERKWKLELYAPLKEKIPFKTVQKKSLSASFENFDYQILLEKGEFSESTNNSGCAYFLDINPQSSQIQMLMSKR